MSRLLINTFKTIFNIKPRGDNKMGAKTTNRPEIVETNDGFTLIDGEGNLVSTYVRRRDAVRGAQRRGLMI